MQFLAEATVIVALFATLCIVISEKCRKWLAEESSQGMPYVFWTRAIMLILVCSLPFVAKNTLDPKKLLPLALYFLAPAFILTLKKWRGWGNLPDLAMALCIFVPAVFRWIPAWIKTESGPSIPIAYWGMSIYLLAILPVATDLQIHARWKISRNDLKIIAIAIPILFVLIVPLGMHVHFLVPGWGFFQTHLIWKIISLPLVFAGIFISVAIPEEILYRVVMQGILSKRFGNMASILFAAIIFGFGHITRRVATSKTQFGYPNWWYVLFAAIAGLGYGYVYYKCKSLVACASIHACVDMIWHVFFSN